MAESDDIEEYVIDNTAGAFVLITLQEDGRLKVVTNMSEGGAASMIVAAARSAKDKLA